MSSCNAISPLIIAWHRILCCLFEASFILPGGVMSLIQESGLAALAKGGDGPFTFQGTLQV